MEIFVEEKSRAVNKVSARQWELLFMLFDIRDCNEISISDLGKHEIILDYLMNSVSGKISPSKSFRGSRYLNYRLRLNGITTNPFLHYLFSEIGEAALQRTFGALSTSQTAMLRSACDEEWYIYQNEDVERSGVDGFIHYMVEGWRQGRDPSPSFSTTGYLRRYVDIAASGLNPFQHWVLSGRQEGRIAEPFDSLEGIDAEKRSFLDKLFDADFYRQTSNSTEIEQNLLLRDYMQSGWKKGLDPTRSFDGYFYSKLHRIRENPFLHYLVHRCGLHALHEAFDCLPANAIKIIREAFDKDWYCYCYPDVYERGEDPFIHYMTCGWTERLDPSPTFSTSAYLNRYPDIKNCLMNPYHHWVLYGRDEGRIGSSAFRNVRDRPYLPTICAVLVNTTDAVIDLPMLRSVLDQSYARMEFAVVGLPLTVSTRGILDREVSLRGLAAVDITSTEIPSDLTTLWQIGSNSTEADLVWFVGADILYAPDFVEKTISSFADNSVEIAFGTISVSFGQEQIASATDSVVYKNTAKWNRHLVKLAANWFAHPTSHGQEVELHRTFVWRRSSLPAECWHTAAEIGSYGPLFLYIYMAAGGQAAWVRDAVGVTHVCRARDPQSQSNEARQTFIAELRRVWGVPQSAVESYFRASVKQRDSNGAQQFSEGECRLINQVLLVERSKIHVLLLSHGIFAGGGENFPIQLANSLRKLGVNVSILIFNTSTSNEEMRRTIDPLVAIYEAEFVAEYGSEKFVRDAGFSIIHSHGVVGEKYFFDAWDASLHIPYLVTLHGSYENMSDEDLPEASVEKIERRVDHFCYTAEKNLTRLAPYGVEQSRLTKVINAMPIDTVDFPLTRAEMGIDDDAVVFTLVARGVSEKGWQIAIDAFKITQDARPDRRMHLCLVGEGDETERLTREYGADPSISFLGYQLRIHGLYRISDVAIVPTRFSGESYPLCIIQAMQTSTPIIASEIGDIPSMLKLGNVRGGILVPPLADNVRFTQLFAESMIELLNDPMRKRLSEGAYKISGRYDMSQLTNDYISLYERLIRKRLSDGSCGGKL